MKLKFTFMCDNLHQGAEEGRGSYILNCIVNIFTFLSNVQYFYDRGGGSEFLVLKEIIFPLVILGAG